MSDSEVRGAVRFCLERECVREGRVGVPGCDESKSKSMSSRECKWVVSDRACRDVDVDGVAVAVAGGKTYNNDPLRGAIQKQIVGSRNLITSSAKPHSTL
jgi:hypothetical protein